MERTKYAFTLTWPDGSPAAVLGVDEYPDDPPGTGFIWMVGSAELDRRPLAFARRSRGLIPEVFSKTPHGLLHTFVHSRRTTNLNFACRWLGFEITHALPSPGDNLPARFHLEVRRGAPGPRPMMKLTVELPDSLKGRFSGHQGGQVVIILRKGAVAAQALKALSLEPEAAKGMHLDGKPAGLSDALPPGALLSLRI